MSEQLYRKKALSKLNSPDELKDIISVTNPGVWIVLVALLLLLLGACCWGFFGEIEITSNVDFFVVGDKTYAQIPINDVWDIRVGSPVRIGNVKLSVTEIIINETKQVAEVYIDYWFPNMFSIGGQIVTKVLHPVELIFN